MKRLRTFTFKEAFVKKKDMIQRLKCRIEFVYRDAAYAKVLYEDVATARGRPRATTESGAPRTGSARPNDPHVFARYQYDVWTLMTIQSLSVFSKSH